MSAAETIYLSNEQQDQTPERAMLNLAAHGLEAGLLASTDYYGYTARIALPFALVSDDQETFRLWLVTWLHGTGSQPGEAYAAIYVVSTDVEKPLFDDRAPLAIFHATGYGCTHPPILYYEMTFVETWTSWRFVLGQALTQRILPAILGTEQRYYTMQQVVGAENALWRTYATMGIDAK